MNGYYNIVILVNPKVIFIVDLFYFATVFYLG